MLVMKYFKKIAANSIMFYYCISVSTPVSNISISPSVYLNSYISTIFYYHECEKRYIIYKYNV